MRKSRNNKMNNDEKVFKIYIKPFISNIGYELEKGDNDIDIISLEFKSNKKEYSSVQYISMQFDNVIKYLKTLLLTANKKVEKQQLIKRLEKSNDTHVLSLFENIESNMLTIDIVDMNSDIVYKIANIVDCVEFDNYLSSETIDEYYHPNISNMNNLEDYSLSRAMFILDVKNNYNSTLNVISGIAKYFELFTDAIFTGKVEILNSTTIDLEKELRNELILLKSYNNRL